MSFQQKYKNRLRYFLELSYNGTNYHGWQFQPNAITVQEVLEEALSNILSDNINIVGAGRTDTGVHALGQVAHFDLDTAIQDGQLKNAINARLPKEIIITELDQVSYDFHARFSAKKRYYAYQCYSGENLLFKNQSWILSNINIDILNKLAGILIGKFDFLSFSTSSFILLYNNNNIK